MPMVTVGTIEGTCNERLVGDPVRISEAAAEEIAGLCPKCGTQRGLMALNKSDCNCWKKEVCCPECMDHSWE